MPMTALTGSRLRERRTALGLRQSDLAERAGISPSYLNLIEHNRRNVTPRFWPGWPRPWAPIRPALPKAPMPP